MLLVAHLKASGATIKLKDRALLNMLVVTKVYLNGKMVTFKEIGAKRK